YAGRVKDVVFEQTPRFIDAPLDLTMTCDTPGAEIFFTFNGEVATREDGFLYEVPVSVDETLAVRARAFKEGLLPSYVTTRTY
ncbi:MAG: chitobiase/beta-hexosaminidase C-terminal domain-containing protein, partial [Verrucomicrobiales bacterium]